MRRLAAVVLVLGMLSASSLAASPIERSIPADGLLAFEVWRDGSRIGTHRLTFASTGGRLTVDIDIHLAVDIAMITVYRYVHRNRETWQDGRLVGMESTTDDDGTPNKVLATPSERALAIDGTRFRGAVPGEMLPTTYWRRDTVERSRLISSQDGRIFDVAVTPLGPDKVTVAGREVAAERYAMRGDLDLDLWYDGKGEWVKLTFAASDGSMIEYRRVNPAGIRVGGK